MDDRRHDRDAMRLIAGSGLATGIVILVLAGDYLAVRLKTEHDRARHPELAEICRMLDNREERLTLAAGLSLLGTVETARLDRPQWAQYQVAMGDAYAHDLGSRHDVDYASRIRFAVCCYQSALRGELPRRRQNEVRLRMAELYLAIGEWQQAADWYAMLEMNLLPYESQSAVYLDWGTCLRRAGDPEGAVQKLERVVNEGIWEQRQHAQIAQLQVIVGHLVEPPPGSTWHPAVEDARRLIEQLRADTTLADPARRTAELANCRLALLAGDFEALVKQVSDLQLSGTNSRVKLEALEILTEGILRQQRWEYAATVVNACMSRFRGNTRAGAMAGRLLISQLDRLPPDAALEAVRQVILRHADPDLALRMLEALAAPDGGYCRQLESVTEGRHLAERAVALGKAVASHHTRDWQRARELAWYLQALAAATEPNWTRVEYCLAKVAGGEPAPAEAGGEPAWLAEAAYLDLRAALSQPRDPAVQALRAQRFLSRYPGHARTPEILYRLGQAYHGMGLREQSLEVAQQSFLKTVWELGNQGQEPAIDRRQWLSTIGSVICSYADAGQPAKADRLFKMYGDYLVEQPGSARVLAAAARAAEAAGQPREAIRRYDLALGRVTDPAERMPLAVTRAVLALQVDLPEAMTSCRAAIATLAEGSTPGEWSRQRLLRQAQDELLRQTAARHPERLQEELAAIKVSAGDETWFSAWLLRTMSSELAARELSDWHRAYRQIIDTGLPDKAADGPTNGFLRRQVTLIEGLVAIDERIRELQQEGTVP